MDDDLILGPVTYFKYPSSNEPEGDFDPNESDKSQSSDFQYDQDMYRDSSNHSSGNNQDYQESYQPSPSYNMQQENYNNSYQCESFAQQVPDEMREVKMEPAEYNVQEHNHHQMEHQMHYNHPYPPPLNNMHQNGEWNTGWPQQMYYNSPHYQHPMHLNNAMYSPHHDVPSLPQQMYHEVEQSQSPYAPEQSLQNTPKKRGRKKKIKLEPENVPNGNGFSTDIMKILSDAERDGATEVKIVKERRKHDRFNGMPEEEVSKRTLPDLLAENLDIVIVGINPGLFAAYKGHHYAGPGNHFWKCLFLSGLIPTQMTADDDYKLLECGVGFTNMVERATKGSSDLTRKEIKEGGQILLEKLQKYRPKIAVFNGKLIYEVFSGKKEFNFGRQPDFVDGTNTYIWVMPSSSARCAQLPRATDKVPYYEALKKFRDYLNGTITVLDENDLIFTYSKLKTFPRNVVKAEPMDEMEGCESIKQAALKTPTRRRRSKNEDGKTPEAVTPDGIVKKKRGRPRKIRPEELAALAEAQAMKEASNSSPSGEVVSSQYFQKEIKSEIVSPPVSPKKGRNFSELDDKNEDSSDSTFQTYDFGPDELGAHLRVLLPKQDFLSEPKE